MFSYCAHIFVVLWVSSTILDVCAPKKQRFRPRQQKRPATSHIVKDSGNCSCVLLRIFPVSLNSRERWKLQWNCTLKFKARLRNKTLICKPHLSPPWANAPTRSSISAIKLHLTKNPIVCSFVTWTSNSFFCSEVSAGGNSVLPQGQHNIRGGMGTSAGLFIGSTTCGQVAAARRYPLSSPAAVSFSQEFQVPRSR